MRSYPGLEVTVEVDCGNAPRKVQVRDWLIALAAGDVDTVCRALHPGVVWESAGRDRYEGIAEVQSHLAKLTETAVQRLEIRHLLSHGKQVAAEGATNAARFAHVITYSGHGKTAKIVDIVTYTTPDNWGQV